MREALGRRTVDELRASGEDKKLIALCEHFQDVDWAQVAAQFHTTPETARSVYMRSLLAF